MPHVTTALASVAVAPGRSELREFPLPDVGDEAGLLRVEAAGVCGTDVAGYARTAPARILGHENVGRLVRLGAGAARRWGLAEGDRVAVEEYLPCGHCDRCRTTDYRYCAATDSRGGGIRYGSTPVTVAPALWGGYAQYLYLHPDSVLHRVPEDVPAERLALALPVSNGYEWAVLEGGARPGTSVVVLGPGQQGIACAFAAKLAGADHVTVTGLGGDRHRLDLARRLGADLTLDAERDDVVAAMADLTRGAGVDLVIDTARGDAATLGPAVAMAGQRGTVLMSTAPDTADGLPLRAAQWKCLSLRGVRGHSHRAVEWAVSVLAEERHGLGAMCSRSFGLAEVDRAIRATGGEPAGADCVHVTVDPWRDTGGEGGV
ncbi:zinc-binding dehydrogenase [Streptomyces sp. NPDC050560]|uniref:zinc-binding dehydrogenase n=1 Tax=Streptomyces sp. NPDC050560 TaxID=3365630 RepID=UPI00379F4404